VDGRSDFYGPAVGRQYLDLLNAAPNWESTTVANGFDVALLPLEWPLAQLLMRHPGWHVRYLDRQAILLERQGHAGLNPKPDSTERIHGEQADRFGTSVAQSLRGHSEFMRVQTRQQAEEKAAKLGVKLVFPIFFCILPSLFVVTVGPVVVRIVRELIPMMVNM
jgi:hypothetical protein